MLRRVVEFHPSAIAVLDANPFGFALIDLIARAELGLHIVVHWQRSWSGRFLAVREALEERYGLSLPFAADAPFVADHAAWVTSDPDRAAGRIGEGERFAPLAGWSEEDVLAYVSAHNVPGIASMSAARAINLRRDDDLDTPRARFAN